MSVDQKKSVYRSGRCDDLQQWPTNLEGSVYCGTRKPSVEVTLITLARRTSCYLLTVSNSCLLHRHDRYDVAKKRNVKFKFCTVLHCSTVFVLSEPLTIVTMTINLFFVVVNYLLANVLAVHCVQKKNTPLCFLL